MTQIVAEISGNHGGSPIKAWDLLTAARDCGCHYAKFQYYRPEDMPDLSYLTSEMYQKLAVPDEWLDTLFLRASKLGIGLFASVFSGRAARMLCEYDVPYIKIASPESTRLPMDTYWDIVSVTPPEVNLIVSTGAGDYDQMAKLLTRHDGDMMYCPPGHPAQITNRVLREFTLKSYWGVSDHTAGIRAPLAFIRAGAAMVEKHLKLDDNCVDAAFSASPTIMKQLCRLVGR